MYFLLTFDPRRGEAAAVETSADETEAMERLFVAENEHSHDALEVVLLIAENETDLIKTHTRFLKSLDQLLEPA